MSDHATAELLKAEAERSQDLIQGLRDATDKLVDRITDGDILAARYQAEREAARLELARYRVAVAAAVRAILSDQCLSPEADGTVWRIETFLGIDRDEPSTPEQDELAKALEALPYRDPKDAAACTGSGAIWCPVHGACLCCRADLVPVNVAGTCPLHREGSSHNMVSPGVVAVEEPIHAEARRCLETARLRVGEGVRAQRRRVESAETLEHCTPPDALACPVHGRCACGQDRSACPLHSDRSFHAAPIAAKTIREFQDQGVLPSPDDGKPLLSDQQVQDDPFSLANTATPELVAKADRVLADLVEGDGELSPEQAERFRRIHDAGMVECRTCGGKGSYRVQSPDLPVRNLPMRCRDCDGTGQMPAADRVVCPECLGTGGPDSTTGLMNCSGCNGEGEIPRPQPKGADNAAEDERSRDLDAADAEAPG